MLPLRSASAIRAATHRPPSAYCSRPDRPRDTRAHERSPSERSGPGGNRECREPRHAEAVARCVFGGVRGVPENVLETFQAPAPLQLGIPQVPHLNMLRLADWPSDTKSLPSNAPSKILEPNFISSRHSLVLVLENKQQSPARCGASWLRSRGTRNIKLRFVQL
jgi:hypothetical protein